MIYSDNSFSLDIPCKCEGRCIKRDFYFLKDFFFFRLELNEAFWLNLFRSTQWLKAEVDLDLTPTMTDLWDQYGPQIYWPEFCQTERKVSWKADTYTVYLSTLTKTLPCFLVNIEVIYRNGYSFVTEGHPWAKKEKHLFI